MADNVKFLVKDKEGIKTLVGNSLVLINEPLTSEVFDKYGFNSLDILLNCEYFMKDTNDVFEVLQNRATTDAKLIINYDATKTLLRQKIPIPLKGVENIESFKVLTPINVVNFESKIVLSTDNGKTWQAFHDVWHNIDFTFDSIVKDGNTLYDMECIPDKQLTRYLSGKELLIGIAVVSNSQFDTGLIKIQITVTNKTNTYIKAIAGKDFTYDISKQYNANTAFITFKTAAVYIV